MHFNQLRCFYLQLSLRLAKIFNSNKFIYLNFIEKKKQKQNVKTDYFNNYKNTLFEMLHLTKAYRV